MTNAPEPSMRNDVRASTDRCLGRPLPQRADDRLAAGCRNETRSTQPVTDSMQSLGFTLRRHWLAGSVSCCSRARALYAVPRTALLGAILLTGYLGARLRFTCGPGARCSAMCSSARMSGSPCGQDCWRETARRVRRCLLADKQGSMKASRLTPEKTPLESRQAILTGVLLAREHPVLTPEA